MNEKYINDKIIKSSSIYKISNESSFNTKKPKLFIKWNKYNNNLYNSFHNNKTNFKNFQKSKINENKKFIKHMYGAGILPYQTGENGKIYLLLGKDNENNWSDFGGKCELQDNNNIKETASREFFEESLNSIIDINTTREMLNYETNYKLITSKTLSGNPYYMFILRLPMLPDTSKDRFKKTWWLAAS